jgi:hypothetical protein
LNDSLGSTHWLEIKVEASGGNRDTLGATIKLTAGGATQYEHVSLPPLLSIGKSAKAAVGK